MAKGKKNVKQVPPVKPAQNIQSQPPKRQPPSRQEDLTSIPSVAQPKHVPIPNVPQLAEITFEFLMLLFSVVSLALQYLNLYRTVFWRPESYTKYAMHFHLIDKGLVYFIVTLLARRFVWSILKFIITRTLHSSYLRITMTVARIVFMIGLVGLLSYWFYCIASHFNVIRVIALFYPFSFYVFKFKLEASAFLEVIPGPVFIDERPPKNQKNIKKPRQMYSIRPINHACTNSAESVRGEVKFLKDDCNKRIAQVIFQTIIIVHYTAVVPCIFAPNALYYDYMWVKIHTFFVAVTFFVWHLIYCFPARYCDVLHRSSLHLGGWTKLDSNQSQGPSNPWSPTILWPQGTQVKYLKDYYRADGVANAAEPGNHTHSRLFGLFSEPWKGFQLVEVSLHLTCSLMHLAFLISLSQWQQILTVAITLVMSDGALYFLLRDYLILKKVYQFEQCQQEKLTN